MRIGNSLAGRNINRQLFAIQLRFRRNVLCGSFFHTFNFKFLINSLRAEGTRNTKPSPIRSTLAATA